MMLPEFEPYKYQKFSQFEPFFHILLKAQVRVGNELKEWSSSIEYISATQVF